MNIIDQLMIEHASLRIQFKFAREINSDRIFEIEDFVRNCHAKIEDEAVFPRLGELFDAKDEKDAKLTLSRLQADHKMIGTIGDQLKQWTIQGDLETLKKRMILYINTVELHNNTEELSIFPSWDFNEHEEKDASAKYRKIIHDFGLDKYFGVTGFSERLLDRVAQ